MKQIYLALFSILMMGVLISCSDTSESKTSQEHQEGPFYVEFVSCSKGNEFSKSSLSSMIDEWRNLPLSDDLRGSFLYDPTKEQNAFGPSMWWELEWSSKVNADNAWKEWNQNESVSAWSEKYQNVILCDGAGRNAWDIVIPISSSHFGESNNSGNFFSQYWTCTYKNRAGRSEMEDFLLMHSAKIKSSELDGTGYHYGVYFDRRSDDASHSEVQANLVWGEWAISQEAMDRQNENFDNNFQEVFEEFDKIGSCLDNPDTFESWMLYSQDNQTFKPVF